ncbi:hypothetical protein [Myxosarcina sp. GI1]|nr:hypothetical protein [Myxosarcina sp. GI1]
MFDVFGKTIDGTQLSTSKWRSLHALPIPISDRRTIRTTTS